MKTVKPLFIFLLVLIGLGSARQAKAQPDVSVTFNTFYDDLSPYGHWIDHPRYGQVWVYDAPGFRPYYTDGHWEYTDYGWEWISDYEWGWAPFHYGRWELDPEFGWVWIPGYEWAPAWVMWSENDGYYGWAPLGYNVGFDVSINYIPAERWIYAPRGYITSPRIRDYCVPFDRSRNFYRHSVEINNFYGRGGHRFMMGPDRGEVERITHQHIQPRQVNYERNFRSERDNRRDNYRPDNGFRGNNRQDNRFERNQNTNPWNNNGRPQNFPEQRRNNWPGNENNRQPENRRNDPFPQHNGNDNFRNNVPEQHRNPEPMNNNRERRQFNEQQSQGNQRMREFRQEQRPPAQVPGSFGRGEEQRGNIRHFDGNGGNNGGGREWNGGRPNRRG